MKYQGRITDPKDLVTKEYVDNGLSGKQATLTFDQTPTAGSSNPVTSGGVKAALDDKADAEALAIVANGNTHIAITAEQYVYVKNHGTLAEGLYKAKSNISANATLSTSNLTAVSNGGLNAACVPVHITPTALATSGDTIVSFERNECYQLGRLVVINMRIIVSKYVAGTIPIIGGLPACANASNTPTSNGYGVLARTQISAQPTSAFTLLPEGAIAFTNGSTPISSNVNYFVSGCYISA